jgi:transposase
VSRLLKHWGLSPQKPVFRAYEQSPVAVKKWLSEQYPRIRQRAQKQRGMVLWLDELGIRPQHTAGKSYAPRGKTPVLRKTGNRFYLSEMAAISNQGQLVFMIAEGNFNGTVFVRFLNKLIKSFDKKVFLIADNHPVHLGTRAGQWLATHRGKLEMFLLPGYSPELNPVEYFNQDVKNNAAGKARPGNKEELKKVVATFAKRKKKNPEHVKKYFHADKVKYAL